MFRWLMMAAAAVTLVSCATPYQQSGLLGGFDVRELRPDVFRVAFQGNGFTTRESVQVYWLNRCAELAVEKGFAGFEILSDMQFVTRHPTPEDHVAPALNSSLASLQIRPSLSQDEIADFAAWRQQGSLASRSDAPTRMAAVMFIYGGGASIPKPGIEGDVHFLPAPVESAPPKVFNAKVLLAQLDPLIKGEKCGGNICPHVHEYLLPKGKLN
ncbi:CC0125/CC1285 family lipoprotein [Bradyrhizobium sp.]|uniref:CC0125/CC1285 family lipoprotein n=1 Tax=Bradyrhizobium sp. TaxID=376 RepID=UPI003C351354